VNENDLPERLWATHPPRGVSAIVASEHMYATRRRDQQALYIRQDVAHRDAEDRVRADVASCHRQIEMLRFQSSLLRATVKLALAWMRGTPLMTEGDRIVLRALADALETEDALFREAKTVEEAKKAHGG